MRHLLTLYLSLKYRSKLILTCILSGFIPMITLGVFCYTETRNLLLDKELDNLSSAIDISYNSLEYQIQIYENLITYLALSETIINVSSAENQTIIEKFEMLNYEYDVLLDTIYAQHPEISQITLYVDRTDLFHGKQLRPLSDLESEIWYDSLEEHPTSVWHMDEEGYLCLFHRVATPYIRYITSFSPTVYASGSARKKYLAYWPIFPGTTIYRLQIAAKHFMTIRTNPLRGAIPLTITGRQRSVPHSITTG